MMRPIAIATVFALVSVAVDAVDNVDRPSHSETHKGSERRCGERASRRTTVASWCHCDPGLIAVNITGITQLQGSTATNSRRHCNQGRRKAHFHVKNIGKCDCVSPNDADLPNESTPRSPVTWPHAQGDDSSEAHSLNRRAADQPELKIARSGWSEHYTRNDFGWWDGSPDDVKGHMVTRSFVVHNPTVLQCRPGRRLGFEYVPTLLEWPGSDVSGANRPARASGQLPKTARPLTLHGVHNGHPLVPKHLVPSAVSSARSTTSVAPAGGRGAKPTIIVAFQRIHWTNHFHYGTLRWSVHTLTLCAQAAALYNLTLADVTCFPVATFSGIGSTNKNVQVVDNDEWPQLRNFQHKVFNRGFHQSCADLEGASVLAITFGEAVSALLNFPFGSPRYVAGGALPHLLPAAQDRLSRCMQGDDGAISGGWVPEVEADCRTIARQNRSHGYSTDLPRFMGLRQPLAELRARVVGPEPVRPISRRVVLFQRNGCPFPKRFRRDNNMWKTRFAASQKHRCIINIDEVELSLQAAGFDVDVVDWGDHQYIDYGSVVQEMQNVSVFIGVEGSGSLHSLWMPAGRSGFLQLHPTRWEPSSYWGNGTVDLYTEAWVHYYGICVHDWPLPDIHATPIDAAALAGAVEQLHSRLLAGTCRTCLLEQSSGLCRKVSVFN